MSEFQPAHWSEFAWSWILPADQECGIFGAWFSKIRGKVWTVWFLLRPDCEWFWGYENIPEINYKAISLGPFLKITWSNW